MHRETVRDVADLTGAAITTRGVYVPPGHRLPEGERKLFLLIQVRANVRHLSDRHRLCVGGSLVQRLLLLLSGLMGFGQSCIHGLRAQRASVSHHHQDEEPVSLARRWL